MENQHISHYRILDKLGAGGMGVVWRALDTRLDREVAIKVLPTDFAHDAELLKRFEQEARATSALNHPNILTVHDIGSHAGAPYIVAELLEGEELRAQLNHGPLPVKRALDYAQQIAAGLAAAHEKGIVHRDLKPENLFVTKDGRVKILDFGLAKLKPPKPRGGIDSEAATQNLVKQPLTNPGVVLGTVGYMSPEQVRGQEADQRSDIFAFGIILHEMLAGRRTFTGASLVEVMHAILKDEPAELSETNAKVSPALEKIVRHCLEKQPERRFHSAHDLGYALEALVTPSSAGANRTEATQALTAVARTAGQGWRDYRLAWLTAAVLLLAALGFAWAYFTRPQTAPAARLLKLAITPPENASFENLALSPDGHWLAFTAATGGKVQLWVRALDSTEARALPGTEGARLPFWSPDSHWLAYFAGGLLKKIELSGGPPQTLCSTGMPQGGTWNRDGVILFSRSAAGLRKVSAAGGEVRAVLVPDLTRQELGYSAPSFLPDGRHFVYTVQSPKKETQGIYLGSLDGRVKQRLLADLSVVRYAPPGFLLFQRAGALMAQSFDSEKLQLGGEAFSLAERTRNFSVSNTGVLVLDSYVNRLSRQLLWLGRDGQQLS